MSFSTNSYSSSYWIYLPLAKCFWLHCDILIDICDNAIGPGSTEVNFILQVFPFDINGIVIYSNQQVTS